MPALQNVIALLYDFDLTLSPHYMQEPLFRKYNVDGEKFWQEVDNLLKEEAKKGNDLDDECAYLNLILRYAKLGKFFQLSNKKLRELGKEITFFPGIPEFFPRMNQIFSEKSPYHLYGITLEHYVLSTGLKEMILGSAVSPYLSGVFASGFLENKVGEINEIGRAVGYTKKTEFIHWINKGANVNPDIDINGVLPPAYRRVPFENMIYIGDGPTDVSCFAMLNRRGGKGLAVYNPQSEDSFQKAYLLLEQGRVFSFSPADYSEGSHTSKTLEWMVRNIAECIINTYEAEREATMTSAPRH